MPSDVSLRRAGSVYGPLLADALATETAEKASIEQHGLAVITTPGVLVSLRVALFALLLGRHYTFLGSWGLAAFFTAHGRNARFAAQGVQCA